MAKSNKKTAIPDLLRALDLRQTLVSCNAAGCPLSNADLLAAGGGQYALAPKKNLPVGYEQVAEHFGKRLDQLSALKDVGFDSGRIGRHRHGGNAGSVARWIGRLSSPAQCSARRHEPGNQRANPT